VVRSFPSASLFLLSDRRGRRNLRHFQDLGDLVVQIEFNGDDIPFGQLMREDVGISHGQCPGLSLFGLERDRPLVLIDRHDLAPAEDGGVTGRNPRAHGNEDTEGKYE